MSKSIKAFTRFIGGISDYRHESLIPDSYYFGRSIDVRSDPRHVTILPRTVKESGSVVTDLIKWSDVYNTTLDVYSYGNAGNIYKRTSARSWSLLRTVSNSHGNGIVYNPEDNYLHYTTDKTLGRYGPLSAASPTFSDDFLGAQGGVPLNTASLDMESGSSMYVTAVDSASLSITGDITIEGYFKPESLPAAASQMVLVSKWNGSSDERSYKFDLAAVSAVFGDGSDGALTISSNTTQTLIDSACSGTAASYSLTATNVSFATGQKILIHQTRGTNAGMWERNEIASYTAGTITLVNALANTYVNGPTGVSQVIVLPEYTNVTVNAGVTWSAKAWNGTVGGILCFLANGTVTVSGTISAAGGAGSSDVQADNTGGGTGGGFRGGNAGYFSGNNCAYRGEGTGGLGGDQNVTANGNGGGAGGKVSDGSGGAGGSGGHGAAGTEGGPDASRGGDAGGAAGTADLTTMVFGGGGGGFKETPTNRSAGGGSGGGIVFFYGATTTISGAINVNGGAGGSINGGTLGTSGGAGGAVLIKAQTATLGSNLITAAGGASGGTWGQAGAVGRIHLDYYTSYTGTTSPTLDVTQDNNLVTSTSYQLRLSVSATDGTAGNSETLAKSIPSNPSTSTWYHWAVAWDASAAQAEFFVNGASIGTATGAKTSIYNSTALLAVGASFDDAGTAEKFFDGKVDEIRIWNDLRTAAELFNNKETEIAVNSANLQAYYQVDSSTDDSTSNANNLTLVNAPTYDTADVPFASPTSRQDLDQSLDTSGQTYAVPTAISEAAAGRQTFTPAKDPQKSIEVLVADTGDDGDWTLTVHDAQNRVIATSTITHANMHTGDMEFTFSTPWRPMTNFTNEYHFHLTVTSTTGTPTVTTTTLNDLETVDFHTYYQFLVEDTAWHPEARFLHFMVVGNERYVGIYEATLYTPHKLVLSAGWRVRCFGYWQEYLAIGCMRGTNIYDNDLGRIYFWDGYSSTFNFFIDIPEGGVNALLGTRGQLYIWAGYRADLLVYQGGSYAQKVKETPLLDAGNYAEVYPGAVSMWRANVRYGLAGASDSSDIGKGVYTWGSTNYRYPDILTFDYPISTGNYGSTVNIGSIFPVNQELMVAWQDGSAYGVDYIDVDNAPYPTANIEFMVEDLDVPYKEKEALQLTATFDALLTGESINVKYRNEENDTGWNENADDPAVGDITVKQMITNGRYYHLRMSVDLTTSVSTSPTLKSVVLSSEQLESEDVIG